ncbi:FeoC-like transcriptional regulator [Chitinibacteraceae bacterium HSL-7]
MGLIELRDYLKERGLTDVRDVARHFDTDVSAVLQVAEVWQARGKLSSESAACSSGGGSCGGCCASPKGPYLKWVG